jgi:N-acetylmuramoyl-L-alanine amidase
MMRKINEIILHCSDSEIGDVDMIREWHKDRGWSDIGYHYVILPDGTVEQGRDICKIGAHCKGHNASSIGICMIGVSHFKEEQFLSLINLIQDLIKTYDIKSIVGHNFYDKKKTCPNFNVELFVKCIESMSLD